MPLVALVHRALGVEQDLARAQVALERCPMQGGAAVAAYEVDVGAALQQYLSARHAHPQTPPTPRICVCVCVQPVMLTEPAVNPF